MSGQQGYDLVVVGAGPNGLAAAVIGARAGLKVVVLEAEAEPGGGCRSFPAESDGAVVHDRCAAVHPLAAASPFFRAFDLPSHGVELLTPEISYAHAWPDGSAEVAYRDVRRTADELAVPRWRSLFGGLAAAADVAAEVALGDFRGGALAAASPRGIASGRGLAAARLGAVAAAGAVDGGARALGSQRAAALLTGVAVHALSAPPSLTAAGTAALLGTTAHGRGWPIPRGGSGAIIDALVADLNRHGGELRTGQQVRTYRELPAARATVLSVTPRQAARILGERLPAKVRRRYERFRVSPVAAAKLDLVVSQPIPWTDPRLRGAVTVHLGGSVQDMQAAERAAAAGRLPARPVVLLSQPGALDTSRVAADGAAPIWAYAHVPTGWEGDPTEAIVAVIEASAPGFRDTIQGALATPASRLETHNLNYHGGDIAGGQVDVGQFIGRPRWAWDPYATTAAGVYLASASTPPGPGVHGMGGMHAMRRVLTEVFGMRLGEGGVAGLLAP